MQYKMQIFNCTLTPFVFAMQDASVKDGGVDSFHHQRWSPSLKDGGYNCRRRNISVGGFLFTPLARAEKFNFQFSKQTSNF